MCFSYFKSAMEERKEGDDLDLIMTRVRRDMAFQHVIGHDAVDGVVCRTPGMGMPDCNNRQAAACHQFVRKCSDVTDPIYATQVDQDPDVSDS